MGWPALLGHPWSQDSKMYCGERFFWDCLLSLSYGVSGRHPLVNIPHFFYFSLTLYFSASASVSFFSLCLSVLLSLFLSLSDTHTHTHTHTHSLSHTLHGVNKSPPWSLLHSYSLHAQRIHWLPQSVVTYIYLLTYLHTPTAQEHGIWVSLRTEDSKVAPSALLFRVFAKQETDSRIHTSFSAFWNDLRLHKRGHDGGQFICVLCHWFPCWVLNTKWATVVIPKALKGSTDCTDRESMGFLWR